MAGGSPGAAAGRTGRSRAGRSRRCGRCAWDTGNVRSRSSPCPLCCSQVGLAHVWIDLRISFYQSLRSGVSLTSEGRQAPVPQNLYFSSQFPLHPAESLSCCYFRLSPTNETRSDPVMGACFSAFQKKAPTLVLPVQLGKRFYSILWDEFLLWRYIAAEFLAWQGCCVSTLHPPARAFHNYEK